MEIEPTARLRAALDTVADEMEQLSFALPSPSRPERVRLRDETARTIRSYLLPRLVHLDEEALVVLLGSTGAGKSTLLNSLAGEAISVAGAVRPTTSRPVLWARRDVADRRLEALAMDAVAISGTDPLLAGATIIDTPDIDSVVSEHRVIAERLLDVADFVVFVTSAQRYADAVPWELLHRMQERSVPLLFVVNRLPASGAEVVVDDLRVRLRRHGIADPVLIEVAEQRLAEGLLAPESVAPLRRRLAAFSDPAARAATIDRSLRGALADVMRRTDQILDAAEQERTEVEALRSGVAAAYELQLDEVERALAAGTLLRSEVLRRWQDFLGTGDLLRVLGEGAGRIRRWARRVFGGRLEHVQGDAREEFASSVVRRVDLAATQAATAWELDPAGSVLLRDAGRGLWTHGERTEQALAETLDDWMAEIAELLEAQGSDKRRRAQIASVGVNVVAFAALLAVFSQTGGLTGGELGIAAGAAAAQQKLLEHIFGTAAARSLIQAARDRLLERLRDVFNQDAGRFFALVDGYPPPIGLKHGLEQLRIVAGETYGR